MDLEKVDDWLVDDNGEDDGIRGAFGLEPGEIRRWLLDGIVILPLTAGVAWLIKTFWG